MPKKFTFWPKQSNISFGKVIRESKNTSLSFWEKRNTEKVLKDENEAHLRNLLWTAVELIFYKHPELEEIGTREQYTEYIKTIFPDSICKDIVYHWVKAWKTFDKFEIRPTCNPETKDHNCFFLTTNYEDARSWGTGDQKRLDEVLPVVINIKKENAWLLEIRTRTDNPYHNRERGVRKDWKLLRDLTEHMWYPGNISKAEVDMLKNEWIDSIIVNDHWWLWRLNKYGHWYIVFNPEQIHILWSKSDIQMFNNYINNKK